MLKDIEQLINQGRLIDANDLLRKLNKNEKDSAEFWYLTGVLMTMANKNEAALGAFEHALARQKLPKYYLGKAFVLLKLGRLKSAFNEAKKANELNDDVDSNFLMFLALLLLLHPKADYYLKKAYKINKRKTLRNLTQFYYRVLKNSKEANEEIKQKIEEKLKRLARTQSQ